MRNLGSEGIGISKMSTVLLLFLALFEKNLKLLGIRYMLLRGDIFISFYGLLPNGG